MAGQTTTYNSTGGGNVIASGTLTNGTPAVGTADFATASNGGWIHALATAGGSVATTSGLQIQIYAKQFSTSGTDTFDTVAMVSITLTMTASSVSARSVLLPSGKYKVVLSNLDATNTVTAQAGSSAFS